MTVKETNLLIWGKLTFGSWSDKLLDSFDVKWVSAPPIVISEA